ncbi:hypothetical protein CCMSSC00406_0009453 [Pleurotus cornucopiae]|uniref:Uncharacterized protein n=1 Tax=Pleurotus cornucopiae TaxID=5321 RepID=A0ACB7J2T0_PLECO|nr:hypothetical protein CCMSSC00406_0009453 [Pleurotus cornucopiae]
MRYLKYYNQRFMSLQSYVFGSLVGSSCVFFLIELYTTTVFVYVGAGPMIPTVGLLTALFTVVSVQAMQYSLPDSFMKTVLFQTVWPSFLLVLWLVTAALQHSLWMTLAPGGCDNLPDGLTGTYYGLRVGFEIACERIGSLQLVAYSSSIALMVYIITLSMLTVKTLDARHPSVWMASTWELPHPEDLHADKSDFNGPHGVHTAPTAPIPPPTSDSTPM